MASGNGHSVLEVIQKTKEITGRNISYEIVERRDGDPAKVVATSKNAEKILDWKTEFSDLETLIRSAWEVYQ